KIPAGFPNPAADHIEQDFSFDRLMDLMYRNFNNS
ncbi:ultraviolet light resistance protein A, partial [Pseudomonas savastanoi pv. glycinea str. race 4]